MFNFFSNVNKNVVDHINYRGTVMTGAITADNGDGTYDVKINKASSAYPSVEPINYGAIYIVGEIVDIIFEYGCRESPKIIGHSNKILQDPAEVEVDYSDYVPPVDIDMGSLAINRDSYFSHGYTLISKDNPANASGKISSIKIWANTDMSSVYVATFFVVSGDYLSTRDWVAIGNVIAGSERTFEVNLNVKIGDYLGIYFYTGRIEANFSGGAGGIFDTGLRIPCTNHNFPYDQDASIISLYGIGKEIK